MWFSQAKFPYFLLTYLSHAKYSLQRLSVIIIHIKMNFILCNTTKVTLFLPFEALSIRHLISTLFQSELLCDSLKSIKSLNYGIPSALLSAPDARGNSLNTQN